MKSCIPFELIARDLLIVAQTSDSSMQNKPSPSYPRHQRRERVFLIESIYDDNINRNRMEIGPIN